MVVPVVVVVVMVMGESSRFLDAVEAVSVGVVGSGCGGGCDCGCWWGVEAIT